MALGPRLARGRAHYQGGTAGAGRASGRARFRSGHRAGRCAGFPSGGAAAGRAAQEAHCCAARSHRGARARAHRAARQSHGAPPALRRGGVLVLPAGVVDRPPPGRRTRARLRRGRGRSRTRSTAYAEGILAVCMPSRPRAHRPRRRRFRATSRHASAKSWAPATARARRSQGRRCRSLRLRWLPGHLQPGRSTTRRAVITPDQQRACSWEADILVTSGGVSAERIRVCRPQRRHDPQQLAARAGRHRLRRETLERRWSRRLARHTAL